MTFHDREEELAALREAHASPEPSFFVVYGRRRVGKTALLKQFCRRHPHVYYLAAQEAEPRQREKFVDQIADRFDERSPRIESWEEALGYLADKLQEEDLVVVIDEFPYLVDENGSLLSYLQAFVDEELADTGSMLVLCGSSVSTMESSVLGHESPLFGRRTGQIDLGPFSFPEARGIIDYDIEEAIASYAVSGGTPMYLTLFDYERPLARNIEEHVLSPTAVLYNEPEFLLRTELRNPSRYMSILEAVALGHTTPNEISGATQIDPGPLSKYLRTLRRLRLLERIVPVTASEKKSKRSRYRIADAFLRFWFRYIEPNRSNIEQNPAGALHGIIEPDLAHHVSTTFEDVCRDALWEAVRRGELPSYARIGSWWHGGEEIDILALAPEDERILFAECKWTKDPVGLSLADSLQAKAEEVRWGSGSRDERYALFSRSGFEDGVEEALGADWSLFSLEDLDALFSPG